MNEQVNPSIRSRKWVSESEYQLLATAPPNVWCRFWQRLLLGWKWEAVVVVIVPQEGVQPAMRPTPQAVVQELSDRNGLLAK